MVQGHREKKNQCDIKNSCITYSYINRDNKQFVTILRYSKSSLFEEVGPMHP